MSGWAAAGQAAGQVLGAGMNMLTSHYDRQAYRESQKDANIANLHLANVAHAEDRRMWERANAYNTPTEQMKRLEAAGLNPNLVYGKNAPGNNAGAIPKYQAPRMEPLPIGGVDWAGIIPAFQDIRLKRQQTDNLAAAETKLKADTLLSAANRAKSIAQEKIYSEELEHKGNIRKHQITALDRNNIKMAADINNKALKGMNIQADTLLKEASRKNAEETGRKLGHQTTIEGAKADLARKNLFATDDVIMRLFAQGELGIEDLLLLAIGGRGIMGGGSKAASKTVKSKIGIPKKNQIKIPKRK